MKHSRSRSSSGNSAEAKKQKPSNSGLTKPPSANKEDQLEFTVQVLVSERVIEDSFIQYLKGSYKHEVTVTPAEERAIYKLDDKHYFYPHDPHEAKNLLLFRLKQLRLTGPGGTRAYDTMIQHVRDALDFEESIKNASWLNYQKLRQLIKKLNKPRNRHETFLKLIILVVKALRESNLPSQYDYQPEGQDEAAQLFDMERMKAISVCIMDFLLYLIDTNEQNQKKREQLLKRLQTKLIDIQKDNYTLDAFDTPDEFLKHLHQTQFEFMINFLTPPQNKSGGKRGTKIKAGKPVNVQKARR